MGGLYAILVSEIDLSMISDEFDSHRLPDVFGLILGLVSKSKVGNRSRGRPEGSFLNSYNTEV